MRDNHFRFHSRVPPLIEGLAPSSILARAAHAAFVVWIAVLALVLPTGAVCAEADAVDDFVRAEMARQKIPGLSLAIVREGRVVRAQGYGFANVEHDVAATERTVFQTGSVGKQFTAMAVMMLVEQGKIGLDDPITGYFDGAPDAWKAITVRHLLTHTSGLKDYESENAESGPRQPGTLDYRRDYTEDELVKVAMEAPLDFTPGTSWSYSNTAFVMLGVLIHKVSGQFYGDFLKERVFGPLSMSSTQVITEGDIVKHRAAGYQLVDGNLKNQDWVAPKLNTTADGSLYTTVIDMAAWDAALRTERLLSKQALQQMWTPVKLQNGTTYPYGFGWALDDQRGYPVIEHGGAWQGFKTYIARYVEQNLAVIVLCNLGDADPDVFAHAVAGLVEPALALPGQRPAEADRDPAQTARLREALSAWANTEPGPQLARGLAESATGTSRDKAQRARVAEQLKKATRFEFVAVDELGSRQLERRGERIARIVYCRLDTGERQRYVRFYVTADGRVAHFATSAL